MAEVQIYRLSNKHNAILEHMIANPTMKLGEVAAIFEVTPAWLSVIVHSDAFQEELRKKRGEVFIPAMLTLQEKLTGMAHLTLDKLGEALDNGKLSPMETLEVSSQTLDRLGYGTKPAQAAGGTTVIVNGAVPTDVLQQARASFGRTYDQQHDRLESSPNTLNHTAAAAEESHIEDAEICDPAPQQQQAGGDRSLGGTE